MKYWEIWMQGYVISGNSQKAHWVGTIEAETFQEACDELFRDDEDYDTYRLIYWGCQLYDNETESRIMFG